jgi:hypothetical protein
MDWIDRLVGVGGQVDQLVVSRVSHVDRERF